MPKSTKLVVSSVLICQVLPIIALAGNSGSGMRHDQHRIDQQNRMNMHDNWRRQQEADNRRVFDEQAERDRIRREREAAEAAERARQAEQARIDREREATRIENERIQREIDEQRRQIEARRQELERQRQAGTFSVTTVTINELLDSFRSVADPAVKEYWATMIVLLDNTNQEAINFLRDVRGWTQEEIAGLNVQQ